MAIPSRVLAGICSAALCAVAVAGATPAASGADVRPEITNSGSALNVMDSYQGGIDVEDAQFAKVGDALEVRGQVVTWLRDGTPVQKANYPGYYRVDSADIGHAISVQVRGASGTIQTSASVPVGGTDTTPTMSLNRRSYTVGQQGTVMASIKVATADGSRPDGRIVLYLGSDDVWANFNSYGCKVSVPSPASGQVSLNLATLKPLSDQTSGRPCLGPGPYGGDSEPVYIQTLQARFVPADPLDLTYSTSGPYWSLQQDTSSIDPRMSLSVTKRHVTKGGHAVAKVGLTLPVRGNATRGTIVLKIRGKVVARKTVNATGTGAKARRSVVTVRTRALKATGRRILTATWNPVIIKDRVTDSRVDTARTAIRVVRR